MSTDFSKNSNTTKNSSLTVKRSSDYLQTLERGLEVIKSFKNSPTLTISESSKITGLSRPVTRRVLLTLENLGYANAKDGRFSLTPKILSLGYAYISSQNIWEIATPYLDELSEKLGESSSLGTLDDTEVVYIARSPVKKVLKISIGVGTRLPAFATSMGKVLLAYLPPEKLDEYFRNTDLQQFTRKTVTDEVIIRENLKLIRERGWEISHDQLEEGLISIAAPIRDVRGEVVAAVNCSTHSGRASKEKVIKEFLPLLLETTEKISNNIDFEIL